MPRGDAEKRAERLLHLIGILNAGDGYAGAELAALMNVSLRTVYRDVVALSTLVPIYYDGGYRLLKDASIQKLAFTREELIALLLGTGVPAVADASHLAAATRAALAKVREELVRRFGEQPDADGAVAVQAKAYDLSPQALRHLRALEDAINAGRRQEIRYRALRSDDETVREVDPYALTFRGHSWYLVGFCHLRGTERFFRVDRIVALKTLPATFQRPAGFSLDDFFANAWEVFTTGVKGAVRIRFAPHLGAAVRAPLARWGALKGGGAEPLVFEGDLPLTAELCWWLLRFGGDAEVLEPTALREMVAAQVHAAAAVYGLLGDAATPTS